MLTPLEILSTIEKAKICLNFLKCAKNLLEPAKTCKIMLKYAKYIFAFPPLLLNNNGSESYFLSPHKTFYFTTF